MRHAAPHIVNLDPESSVDDPDRIPGMVVGALIGGDGGPGGYDGGALPVGRPRALPAVPGAARTAFHRRVDPVSARVLNNRHMDRVADDLPLALLSRPVERNRPRETAADVWREGAPASVGGIAFPASAGILVDRAGVPTEAAAALPGAVQTATATSAETTRHAAQNRQAPDIDDIVERALRTLMSRLAIEQERRGFSRWS